MANTTYFVINSFVKMKVTRWGCLHFVVPRGSMVNKQS